MIYLKTDEEIELMRAANQLVGRTLAEVAKIIAPGVSTLELDKRAEEFIRDNGATPAFLGYNGFPVGEVSPEVLALLRTTKESLYIGIEQAVAGKRVGDISSAVQQYCEARGYHIVRELEGHGIGKNMHEEPGVPNYGRRGTGAELRSGMCICIEPMVNMGSKNVIFDRNDGWTVRTKTGKPSAHFEHCIAIREGKADILSSFDFIKEVLVDREF